MFTTKYINIIFFASAVSFGATSCDSSSDDDGDNPQGSKSKVTVIDYNPAPGQFVNETPEYSTGDSYSVMLAKVQKSIDNGEVVSLGAWGGSITVRVSPAVTTLSGGKFRILGNAFVSGTSNGIDWGSAEPGIVQVMCDTNNNGKADDGDWYTISPGVLANSVTVTYYAHDNSDSDSKYIRWECSDGTSGYLNRVVPHTQNPMFPRWLSNTATMTFSGLRLPSNSEFDSTTGNYRLYPVVNTADSYPNTSSLSILNIADATNADGSPVYLKQVDFIRVYTGVLGCNGMLGEVSTEFGGIEVL